MQSEAASADTEAVASYPDIAKMMKVATLKKSKPFLSPAVSQ